jgi:hypothetical protein
LLLSQYSDALLWMLIARVTFFRVASAAIRYWGRRDGGTVQIAGRDDEIRVDTRAARR